MSEIIKKYDWYATVGHPIRYQYDEWFDGQIRRFTRGKDFTCLPTSFRALIYKEAKKRNLVVRGSIDGNDVVIQAILD